MGHRESSTTYHCYDCCMEGCPTHAATLTLQTTSMAYTFTTPWAKWSFSPIELEVLLELVRQVHHRDNNDLAAYISALSTDPE